jgi:hypothetical protein
MNNYITKYIHYPLFILVVFIMGACSAERELARSYLENTDRIELLVLEPEFVFKSSLKQYEVEGAETMDQYMLDSILLGESLFLQFISDSIFLETYTSAYIEEMRSLNYIVFTGTEMDTFLTVEEPEFIITIAQVELEEYVLPIRDEELVYEYLFYKEIDLNAVSINSWFELTRINADEELDKEILFASHYILDEFEGDFKYYPFTGEIQYAYKIDSLLVSDIYGLAGYLGQKYAGFTNDYLMNTYVYRNLPEDERPKYYFQYNREKNALVPTEDDRFILMDDQ